MIRRREFSGPAHEAKLQGWREKLRFAQKQLQDLRQDCRYVRHAEVEMTVKALLAPNSRRSMLQWIVQLLLFVKWRKQSLAKLLEKERRECNRRVIEKLSTNSEIKALQGLNDRQKCAVICSDDENRILAGAGTGKTYTMVAKARMLIEHEGIKPEEIAFVTFTNPAADEIRARVEETMGKDVAEAMAIGTIHSLARRTQEIAGLPSKKIDRLAEEKNTHARYVQMTKWLEECIENEPELCVDVWRRNGALKQIKLPRDEVLCRYTFKVKGKEEIRVKSMGEWEICRILTQYGISFKYEDPFPVPEKLQDGSGRGYRPDFRISFEVGKDIWLEHWGLDRKGKVAEHWTRSTEQYLEQIAWKRRVHQAAGTDLIETRYGEIQEASLGLVDKTFEETVIGRIAAQMGKSDEDMAASRLSDKDMSALMGSFDRGTYMRLAHEVDRWIQAFRQSTFNVESALEAARQSAGAIEATALAELAVRVMTRYHRMLDDNGTTNHDETVQEAYEKLKKGSVQTPWRSIIVDEYQDVNRAQDAFLQSLTLQAVGSFPAQIFVVGDDWQAIYGFQGGAVNILRSFGEGFPGTVTTVLPQTYRFRDSLAQTTRSFVLRDLSNEDKDITGRDEPSLIGGMPEVVQIVGTDLTTEGKKNWPADGPTAVLEMILDLVGREWKGKGRRPSVMVLARKRKTIGDKNMSEKEKRKQVEERVRSNPTVFAVGNEDEIERRISSIVKNELESGISYPTLRARANRSRVNLDIETITVHKAKGTESDVVVLVDGDPRSVSERSEERALEAALHPLRPEGYNPREEERRIWYVALTRAREKVYVVSPPRDKRHSPLLDELAMNRNRDYEVGKREFEKWCDPYEPPVPCPKCRENGILEGILVRRTSRFGKFAGCSTFAGHDGYEPCKHTEKLCQICGEGIMRRIPSDRAQCNAPSCRHEAPLCGCSPERPMRNNGQSWECQGYGGASRGGCAVKFPLGQ